MLTLVAVVALATFIFCMVHAIVSDALSMTIRNRIPLILVASFVVFAPVAGLGWSAIGAHLAVGAAMLALTFALFAAGVMGGGDAKLIAGTSVWVGLALPLAQYLVWSAMLGGLLTLALVLFRISPLAPATAHLPAFRNFGDRAKGIPYAIALGPAALMVLPSSPVGAWALAVLGLAA